MTATYQQAKDEILGQFKTAWDATGHEARYENTAGDPPTTVAPWARVSLRHFGGEQASLAGDSGTRRWERTGIVTVQIFVPTGEGLSEAYDLAKIVADAYEGQATASQVWFRNVRVNEVGPDGSWFQVNVIAEFIYDEVK